MSNSLSTTTAIAPPDPVPSKSEIQAVIPAHCFERKLPTALGYTAFSLIATILPGILAWQFLPLSLIWLPVWLAYAFVSGTAAVGVWVIAHECGHDAFSDNKRLQNGIGFVLHSALLVPYFSWQRSHAIHHAKTNHVIDGETHVPKRVDTEAGERALGLRRRAGSKVHTAAGIAARLLFGWPVYLLTGATGGPERGVTNHFWPLAPFSKALFPARWAQRVIASAIGVLTVVALLAIWAIAAGSIMPVLALYVAPYLVCNAWLVAYTWMHHTSADTPHYDEPDWSYVRGAFCSIDRPYGRVFDLVHHHIGSTHVAHHLFARIPHYHAVEATEALRNAYPELYRYDPTPIPKALWQISKECVAVTETSDGWRYTATKTTAA
ncbi:MAG: fatty acid desaturase [Acidimicrobiales bacterium]